MIDPAAPRPARPGPSAAGAVAPGSAAPPAALAVEGLASGYAGAMVLRGLTLSIAPGEIFALVGKNGMGKSTFVRTVMGFVRPAKGTVRCAGHDTTGAPPDAMVRRGVAYAPQEKAIFQDLSVADNLRLAAPDERGFRRMLEWVAEHFPLFTRRLKQKAGTLSGGEQKMLMLSRALMVRPRLVLIDEISEGLQPAVVDRIAEILARERAESGTAILIVEQNIGFALRVAQRWAVMNSGEIDDEGVVGADSHGRIIRHLSI